MGRPTLNEDAKNFLAKLKENDGSCGNYNLMGQLDWRKDRYWRTHASVVDEGFATRGRGRGGSIILVPQVDEPTATITPSEIGAAVSGQIAAIYLKETELYTPAKRVIEEDWSRERSYDDFIVEITAQPGRVQTGGTWTRPDISILGTKSYPYLPGRFFDIVTFEIKTADTLDVRGVFEALSHAQFATLAYVVFFTNGKELREYPNSDRAIDLATKHGVGLIAAAQIDKYETWNEVVEPRRNISDPEQANIFIGASFSTDSLNRIIKWHK